MSDHFSPNQDITDLLDSHLLRNRVAVVALHYREPYYSDTVSCLKAQPYEVTVTERHRGVGSLSWAMNRGFSKVAERDGSLPEFVWFVTDVTFDPEVPTRLAAALDADPDLAALHPAHQSDHHHHRPDGSGEVKSVPYLEFTAPMWRSEAFRRCGMLDLDHWYWYQDLVISKSARDLGYSLAVHHGAKVGHVYHRADTSPHPVTRQRYDMRRYRDPVEQKILERKFGLNWRDVLWARV